MLLTACGKTKEFIPVPQPIYLSPPKQLMMSTEIPAWFGTTNGNLIQYTLLLKEAIIYCNQDKQKILESVESQKVTGIN